MANRYCNFTGNQKIMDTYDLIPKGFDKVQVEVDAANVKAKDMQDQVDALVVDGDSSPAIAQALAGTGFSTLNEYNDDVDSKLLGLALENVDQDVAINAINNNLANTVTQGAWTPAINLDMSYVAQFGQYVKIGKQVTLYFYIYGGVNTIGTGEVEISGLPFTVTAISNARFSGIVSNYNIGTLVGALTLFTQDNLNIIRILKNGKAFLSKADFVTGTQFIMGQISYLMK